MSRQLKIENLGDHKHTVPYIRLKGQWLERAGFAAGSRIQLVLVAPGRMELAAVPAEAGNLKPRDN